MVMVASVGAKQEQNHKGDSVEEEWPFWKLCMIALPQLGVQVLWMFLGPNTTAYLKALGASDAFATLNNSAGPVVGFIVGPLVGAWSDQSTSKWGRRRPIIVAGLISTIVAGLLYSGAEQLLGKGNGLYLAAAMQWVLDFTVNAMQTPFRALVSDLSSPKQQLPMQIFFAIVCAAGGFLAFTIMKIYDIAIHHMLELMTIVMLLNVACVGAALSVAREKQFVPTEQKKTSVCGPIMGMCSAFQGMPKAFYGLLFVQCMVWLGNTVWGTYGQVWFTTSVYPGDAEAAEGTAAHIAYADGAKAFGSAGQIGSLFNLALSFLIMGIGMTKFPNHLLYGPCILVGAAVCFMSAFVVGHNHTLAVACFVLSNVPLTAAGSIPYGLVAVWNKAAEQSGKVGSIAMQMAILNCCITVGQQLCTMTLGGLEGSYDVNQSLKGLYIISAVAGLLGGIAAMFLKGGAPEVTSAESLEGSEMETGSTQ